MHKGFTFRVLDVEEGKYVDLACPAEMYDLIALIGTTEKYIIERIYRTEDALIAAVASTTKLSLIAGRYVGKDDPCLIIRAQYGLPALGEILSAFALPHLVPGWMRGSHYGPLMPVSVRNARCTVFDGPPRCIALGFNLCNGELIGLYGTEPADLFDDPAFDETRRKANEIVEFMRYHGEFMPARLGPDQMEYTTLPKVLEKLKDRFRKL
jgi:fructose 1,6-bisphosphate aldolase/phosphatase